MRDTTAPTITLVGSGNQTLQASTGTYADAGATWTDIISGSGTISVATSGSVNMKIPGTYTLSYAIADSSGNT